MKRLIIVLYTLFIAAGASAQFYATGDDPGRLKWYSMDTDNFRIIYPEGNDSLARVYGRNLEIFRPDVGRTTGYRAGGPGKLRMPVVLHSWNTANGSVAWAPKRMDLFTIPSAYNPEPIPWEKMLAVHESRHVTQMQFGMTKAMKPFYRLFGEMFNVLVAVTYPGISAMEGDAVITETAYTNSGRGRTADFLNYYRVAFDNDVRRSWAQWRFASQRNYGPNYYPLGYMTVGGIRHFYNCPEYMSEAYHLAARRPYRFGAFRAVAKEAAGKRRFNDVFMEITDTMAVIWKAEADARAPYIAMEQVSDEPRLYTDYTSNIFIDNKLYSIKKGFLDTPSLVRIGVDETEAGNEERISAFPSQAGKIRFQGNRIWWSETIPHERWMMQAYSKVRFFRGGVVSGEQKWSGDKSLTDNDLLLYNPCPSPDGRMLACAEYFVKGGSALTVVDASDGDIIRRIEAPDGMQIVETAWIGEDIYFSAITDGGYGIHKAGADSFETVLEAQPVMLKDFGSYGEELIFTCDRTGVNELYHLDPQDRKLTRKTSIRHGGESFTYSPDGQWLYFSSQTVKGKMIYRARTSDLLDEKADFTQRHEYMLAEALTAQERAAAARERTVCPEEGAPGAEISDASGSEGNSDEADFSKPKRYRKFPHMFNVHSWAPLYVNVDNIMNISYDRVYEAASLGATGIIQNRLSTAVGEFGYSAHKDPYNPSKWRHSGHARLTYSGLYPILEAEVDFNDRAALQYNMYGYLMDNGTSLSMVSRELTTPSLQASFKAYVPFDLSSGGWYRGVIPQIGYSISNDFLNNSLVYLSTMKEDGYLEGMGPIFVGARYGDNKIMQYATCSLRAYTMMGTPNSAVYPRWGIGTELGAWANLNGAVWFSPMAYAYIYGYVPGFIRSHGIRLSAMYQTKISDSPFGQNITSILPRGFTRSASLKSALGVQKDAMLKLSTDYAMPIYIGDLSLMDSFLYIKRLVVTPHFDYMFIDPFKKKGTETPREGLWSAGCTLALDLESILWLEWPCSIGVSASFNGGPSFAACREDYNAARYYVGPTFNVTF